MCVDFANLNKTCPKYNFPLPKIDRLVDFIVVFEYLSPLDANSGYHQTPMHPDNEEKTVFITDQGIFCYRTMPFILKNVGATYQKMVKKSSRIKINRNMEAYIDDILVKSMIFE